MDRVELCYELIYHVDRVCMILVVAYCYVVWVRSFLPEKDADGNRSAKKAWAVGITYAVVMITIHVIPVYVNGMLAHSLGALLAFLVMFWCDRAYVAQKLFLAITFFCLRWQAWRIANAVSNEIEWHVFIPCFNQTGWWGVLTFFAYTVVSNLIACFLLYGAVRSLLRVYGCRREKMDIREFLLLVMPSASGVCFYGLLRYFDTVYERDTGRSTYELYSSYNIIRLLNAVMSYAVIFVMVYVFRQWKSDIEKDKQQEIFVRQMQDLEAHIAEVEGLYRDMRGLRHDMGNHLMTIERLYSAGECEAAGRYAEALRNEMQAAFGDVVSGNPVTDVLLSVRKKEMEEKGIHFICDFHFPPGGVVNVFDLSVILNNALSNAVEAVERDREEAGIAEGADAGGKPQIAVRSYKVKNMYMIEVANTFKGELMTDVSDNIPRTVKKGEGHGFGLKNIRHAAKKYLGDIEIGKEVCEGGERCVLRVMLQLTTDKGSLTT